VAQLRAHKARSFLTALGIIVGVASVVFIIAALQGLQSYVLKEFETVGARYVFIDGDLPPSMENRMSWRDTQLTLEEIRGIEQNAPSIAKITPMWTPTFEVTYGDVKKEGVRVSGVWPEWHEIEDRPVVRGRPFSRIDDENRRYVCVINDKGVEELNMPSDAVGEYIFIGGRRFLIIGIVETEDPPAMFGGGEARTEILIPFETARKLSPWRWISDARALLSDPEAAEDAEAEVRFVLRRMRDLSGDDEDTFETEVMQSYIDQFNALAASITAVAGGVVAISLLVGGVGIMNIMLVSVSERTREIGLRKAVGARAGIILTQFLTEAVALCLAGGLIGVAIAQGLTILLRSAPDANMEGAEAPVWAIVLALGFSGGVGLIFGMFPAIKAARLDPIEALRHE